VSVTYAFYIALAALDLLFHKDYRSSFATFLSMLDARRFPRFIFYVRGKRIMAWCLDAGLAPDIRTIRLTDIRGAPIATLSIMSALDGCARKEIVACFRASHWRTCYPIVYCLDSLFPLALVVVRMHISHFPRQSSDKSVPETLLSSVH